MASEEGPVEDKVKLDNIAKDKVESIKNDNPDNIADKPNDTIKKENEIIAAIKKSNPEGTLKTAGVSEAREVKYGEHLTKDGRKTVLKPNVTYTTNEGYSYSTDEKGRIRSVEGVLQLGLAERNEYAQKTVGREDRLSEDDGGHLIASIFKGSGGLDNLVAMDGNLNKGEWKKLENMWANALKGKDGKKKINPKPVKLDIEVVYKGDSQRPAKFNIVYQIGKGDPIEVTFLNKKGGK
ncbi:DNA/RNA non-specific endonuclease [Ruminiclostridium herbifermentans]|uniref:DNA/RNA non-specific endonuclease n=2 Tax=Ruminiclostridium herbifermentans TaxID=2488810 RepID=A0A4U7JFW4_9FIRM|nr:DNA/RNA non-specific endonuclease [Ruminiclostridium herbifermentans]